MKLSLISPDDGSLLEQRANTLVDSCGRVYKKKSDVWDLRPQSALRGTLDYEILSHERIRDFPYQVKLGGTIDKSLSRYCSDSKSENVARVLQSGCNGGIALDHGCGRGSLRGMIEAAGYMYTGVDNESGVFAEQWGGKSYEGGATHFCDLHRLPFASESFDFTVSYSVFEHLQNPHVAANELYRVMKSGARGFVAIASLIPFHMDSFYHHTHFGTVALLSSAGFKVEQVAGANWNGFKAIGTMDGLPGPKLIRGAIGVLSYSAHRLLWSLRAIVQRRDRQRDEITRHNMMAGIIRAVISKE